MNRSTVISRWTTVTPRVLRVVLVIVTLLSTIVLSSSSATAATWQSPVTIGASDGYSPEVAVGKDGTAVAAWKSGDSVRAAVRPPGGAFGEPQTIGDDVADAYTHPLSVTIDGHGNAVVVWVGSKLQAATRPAGGTFAAPQTISAPGFGAGPPIVAANASGDVTVVWTSITDPHLPYDYATHIQTAFRPAGGSFSAPSDLSPAAGGADGPKLAVNERGDAVVAWTSGRSVQVATRRAGETFGPAAALAAQPGLTDPAAYAKDVAIDAQGRAAVLWNQTGYVYYEEPGGDDGYRETQSVDAAFGSAGTAFGTTEVVASAAGSTGESIARDSRGNAVVLFSVDTGTRGMYAATRPLGGTFGAPHMLQAESTDDGSVIFDEHDNAIAVWKGWRTSQRIQVAVQPAGGTFGATDVIADGAASDTGRYDGSGTVTHPRIAADGSGNAIAVWTAGEGKVNAALYGEGGPLGKPVATPGKTPVDKVPNTCNPAQAQGSCTTPPQKRGCEAPQVSPPCVIVDPDRAAPRITGLRVTRARFRVARGATAITARARRQRTGGGTVFRMTLSESASVRIAITARGRKPAGPALTRSALAAGANAIAFSGRLGRRALKPGSYTATITATDAAGNKSEATTIGFKIVR